MKRSSARAVLIVVVIAALCSSANLVARAAPVSPPTFTVNSTADLAASPPLNNGVCVASNGKCTLRAAIMKADNYPGGGVTIDLPALSGGDKYALSLGALEISNTMTLNGGGAAATIIDASTVPTYSDVLLVDTFVTAAIAGVTIEGGHTFNSIGSGLSMGYGDEVTLRDSIVTSNTAQNGQGAGIANFGGTLTVTDSLVQDNVAAGGLGGGIIGFIQATTLETVTVSHNSAKQGGGVYVTDGTLKVVGSTISGNSATDAGGGVYDDAASAVAIVNSTLSGNSAASEGGGIGGTNSCVCGGVTLDNATVAGNHAGVQGGGLFGNKVPFVMQNSILDGNVHHSGSFDVPDDCSGATLSGSYDLISAAVGCTISATHDLIGVSALLGPLQNNGGPTFTQALLAGSPAIDAGDPAGCRDNLGVLLTSDQRGAPRPANGAGTTRCDMGAFELQQVLYMPLVRR
jgi:predicted outer membrane repeat protein